MFVCVSVCVVCNLTTDANSKQKKIKQRIIANFDVFYDSIVIEIDFCIWVKFGIRKVFLVPLMLLCCSCRCCMVHLSESIIYATVETASNRQCGGWCDAISIY